MNGHQREIVKAWRDFDSGEISTERLFALVEDATGADAGEISEALYAWDTEGME